MADGIEFNEAVQKVLQEIITVHGAVVFNGDGYSEAWQTEAAERGLPNLRTTVDALPELLTDEAMELFSHYGVFSHREMHSRYEIALEQYILTIGVEARLTLEMANTVVLPPAIRYQTELAANLAVLKSIGAESDTTTFDEVSAAIGALHAGIADLRQQAGARPQRLGGRRGPARPGGPAPRHDRGPRGGRCAGGPGGRRPLAPGHLPGDALHPVGAGDPTHAGHQLDGLGPSLSPS